MSAKAWFFAFVCSAVLWVVLYVAFSVLARVLL